MIPHRGIRLGDRSTIAALSVSSANTLGSYVELIAATPKRAIGLYVLGRNRMTVSGHGQIDVAIGAAGSEVVIAGALPLASGLAPHNYGSWYVPVAIPAGVRVAARMQAQTSTAGFECIVFPVYAEGPWAPSALAAFDDFGADRANSRGTHLDATVVSTYTSWVELSAALAYDYQGITASFTANASSNAAFRSHIVQIGVGAMGSEQVVAQFRPRHPTAGRAIDPHGGLYMPIKVPKGERLSVRSQTSEVTVSDRNLFVTTHLGRV